MKASDLRAGDLVQCVWQPSTSRIVDGCAMPMEHTILGQMGIIVGQKNHCYVVLFPKIGYKHDLSTNALEVISESR